MMMAPFTPRSGVIPPLRGGKNLKPQPPRISPRHARQHITSRTLRWNSTLA